MIGISRDEPDASSSFARDYRIEYPLLTDRDGAVSRAYTGVDDSDHTVPGVVIVRSDGTIVYRQVAATKDDRVAAPQILATADRLLGTSGATPKPATPAIDRVQLRVDVGSAFVDADANLMAGWGVYVPIARYVIVGIEGRQVMRGSLVSRQLFGGVAGLRVPIYGEIAALQLVGMFGWSLIPRNEIYAGWRAGVWFATSPKWALGLEAGMLAKPGPDAFATFGVSRLFGR